ncbi:6738_t:CDS:2 [Ambispora leptoticha]|uniref:6738_t:CDS:1 n=1 Tax=Ambispora leptoticha TaxID=144679 RepID=A0A9N9E847_9GLOM|nr:6738_t:CDS:2 [Ambispora leptoticha]
MSKFQTLFFVIVALFFALAWAAPTNPPTPGGKIKVTGPDGRFKFDSYQAVSWTADYDVPDKWNRKVDVYIARKLGNGPDLLKYVYVGRYNYGNTWAGFQAHVNQGVYYAYVELVPTPDDPSTDVWGTGPLFFIDY